MRLYFPINYQLDSLIYLPLFYQFRYLSNASKLFVPYLVSSCLRRCISLSYRLSWKSSRHQKHFLKNYKMPARQRAYKAFSNIKLFIYFSLNHFPKLVRVFLNTLYICFWSTTMLSFCMKTILSRIKQPNCKMSFIKMIQLT